MIWPIILLVGLFGLLSPTAQADARLDALIGRTLMVGWPGTSPADPSSQLLCHHLAEGRVAGVLFLAHNMQDVDQVQALTDYFARCGGRFSTLLALDQEGGLVDRIGRLPGEPDWPSAAEIGAHPPGYSASFANDMAARIAALGFTINFAPVADLNVFAQSPAIGALGRSYGTGSISAHLEEFIEAHASHEIAVSLKHFPGHGSARSDSHLGFTDVSDTWSAVELVAFLDTMDTAGAIMAGHLVNRQLDDGGLPATLSETMLSDLLRQHLGFEGALVSDDMVMRAITDAYGFEQSVHLSLSAGIDLYLHSNSGPYAADFVDRYHAAVRQALDEGLIRQEDLRAKAARIEAWAH